MRELILTTRFRRDLRRRPGEGRTKQSSGRSSRCWQTTDRWSLTTGLTRLAGGLVRLWECHIESDWLLVWDEDNISVTLMRTGTHSDIFS